jgi:catalase
MRCYFVNEVLKHCKAIEATREGIGLQEASDIKGLTFFDPQGMGKSKLGVVTIGTASDVNAFLGEFIKAIAQHRHWGIEKMPRPPA